VRALRILLAALLVAAVAIAGAPGVAGAQVTLTADKTLCDTAVSNRVNTLDGLLADVNSAPNVTEQDKATLGANLQAAVTGLQALKATFDADTTLVQLRVDCRKVVTGFYVYLFLVPQTHLVVAGDRVLAAAGALNSFASLIDNQIKVAQARGENVASAQGYANDITDKVTAAEQAASSAQAAVLPLTAAGYPGNRPTLTGARSSMGTAAGDLTGALAAAQHAVRALEKL
jgi:hypothetical protein